MIGLVAAVAMSAFSATAGDDLDAFFADFVKKREGIRFLEAEFSQKNISPDETSRAKGKIVYVKPRRIVFRYEEPEVTHLVDGMRMFEYDVELKQVLVYDLEKNPQTEALFMSFDDDATRLREAYDVSFFDPEEQGAKGLMLVPKPGDEETAYFERARLYLREKDYLPFRIEIVNDAESQTIITISGFRINGDLDPDEARVFVPEGTQIIVNDRPFETVGAGGAWLPDDVPESVPAAPAPVPQDAATP